MGAVFTKLLNMSITAGWLILAVLLLRLLFRRAPKWTRCLLWAMVAVRLLFPFSLESVWSLLPSGETVVTQSPTPSAPSIQPGGAQIVIQSGIPIVDNTVNPIISERLPSSPTDSVDLWQIATEIAGYVWVAGAILLAIYALFTYLQLRYRVRASICKGKHIFVCDDIRSPFILGIVKPRIYLPSGMDAQTASYVLAHEQAHIKRCDHWWKPFGYLLLTVYWFHPLVWVAYILLCRDIELACDEKVVRDLQKDERAAYSQALLDCSVSRRLIAACPLAFGEVSVKNRIKSVLHYKKPAFWVIVVSLIACAVVAVCFLTDPKGDDDDTSDLNGFIDAPYYDEDGLFICNTFEYPEEPPFPLPNFSRSDSDLKTAYSYINVTLDAYDAYCATLQQEGFVMEQINNDSFFFRNGCAVFLSYYKRDNGNDGTLYLHYYAERQDVLEGGLSPEEAKTVIGIESPYTPIDVTPTLLFEKTGGQIFIQPRLMDYAGGYQEYGCTAYYTTRNYALPIAFPSVAQTDLDGNGIPEIWTIEQESKDMSSIHRIFSAYENGKLKYRTDFGYRLLCSFVAKDGTLCIAEGLGSEKSNLFEVSIRDGKIYILYQGKWITGVDHSPQPPSTLEFRADTYAQHVAMSWWYSIDVKVENGHIYLDDILYDRVSYVEKYEFLENDHLFSDVYSEEEISETLEKIRNQKGCYVLEAKINDTTDMTYVVYDIEGTYYFLSFSDNGEVRRIHVADVGIMGIFSQLVSADSDEEMYEVVEFNFNELQELPYDAQKVNGVLEVTSQKSLQILFDDYTLKHFFSDYVGKNPYDYFEADIFEKGYIIVIVARYGYSADNYSYFDFKDSLRMSIQETVLNPYLDQPYDYWLDLVLIPCETFSPGLEYFW